MKFKNFRVFSFFGGEDILGILRGVGTLFYTLSFRKIPTKAKFLKESPNKAICIISLNTSEFLL